MIGTTLGNAYVSHVVVLLVEATFGKVIMLVVSVGCVRTVFG